MNVAPASRATSISERWPSCRNPIVGTKPMRACARAMARESARSRIARVSRDRLRCDRPRDVSDLHHYCAFGISTTTPPSSRDA